MKCVPEALVPRKRSDSLWRALAAQVRRRGAHAHARLAEPSRHEPGVFERTHSHGQSDAFRREVAGMIGEGMAAMKATLDAQRA